MRLVAYVLVLSMLTVALTRPRDALVPVAAPVLMGPHAAVGKARARGTEEAAAARPRGVTQPVMPDLQDAPALQVTPGAPGRTGQHEAPEWRWPLSGRARPIRRFDPPAQRWLAGHRGVDLAARPGEKVMAAGAGTVGLAERIAGRGVVTIFHPGGLRTTYLPVRALVRPGDVVAAGQVIGTVEEDGAAHCAASCLHWGLLRGRLYLDPLLLFGRGQVRLLPRWSVGGARPIPR
ncbi:M23 family metallopeptidase [Microbispora sp. H13382]|uniref:M23 family metallopeptidase n=1 Tax=Microbispora sp. H13382 TaxID=2729112 RepID=UPI002175CCC5|nr:M23 family metallopeptidase [Microbispora sp. H13382]